MPSLVYKGTLEFDDGTDTSLLVSHLTECLQRAGATSIRARPEAVSFRGGPFRVKPWHMLAAFDLCELSVNESIHEVHYNLSVQHLVITTSVMAIYAGALAWSETNSLAVPFLFGLGWLWLVVGGLLISIPRFKDFLRDAVDSVPARR